MTSPLASTASMHLSTTVGACCFCKLNWVDSSRPNVGTAMREGTKGETSLVPRPWLPSLTLAKVLTRDKGESTRNVLVIQGIGTSSCTLSLVNMYSQEHMSRLRRLTCSWYHLTQHTWKVDYTALVQALKPD